MEKIGKWCCGLVILFIAGICFAEIPVYCPECKTHLYNYQKEVRPDTQILAEDFKPASDTILQPRESDPMECPLCQTPLNGWEYYGVRHKSKSHTVNGNIVSVLTKDENGFKWIPYDVPDCEVK